MSLLFLGSCHKKSQVQVRTNLKLDQNQYFYTTLISNSQTYIVTTICENSMVNILRLLFCISVISSNGLAFSSLNRHHRVSNRSHVTPRQSSSTPFVGEFDGDKKEVDSTATPTIHLAGGDSSKSISKLSLKNIYTSYLRALEVKPCITKSITAGFIQGIGDILSQFIEYKVSVPTKTSFVLNYTRFYTFLLSGWLYVGPFVHYWYELLWKVNSYIEAKHPWFFSSRRNQSSSQGESTNSSSSNTKQALFSVFLDQTVGVAIFFPFFFYVYDFLEAIVAFAMDSSKVPVFYSLLEKSTSKMKTELWSLLVVQYQIWPVVNYISFGYVPKQFRVLFSNIISVFWNAFLCMKVS